MPTAPAAGTAMHEPGDTRLPGVARIVDSKDRDGTPVRTLYVDTRHIDACAALWNAGGFQQLGLSSYRDAFDTPDIGWIRLFDNVRRLHVCLDRAIDLTPLAEHCVGLEAFFANDNLNGVQDCSAFPRLRSLGQRWSPGMAFPVDMPQLASLALQAFHPKAADLSELPNAPGLASLALFRTGISRLNGLERYGALSELSVAHAPRLSDASAVRDLRELRAISFDRCLRLQHLDRELARLRLQKLQLTGCGPLQAVGFVRAMPELESFVFMGTDVAEGDLSALPGHPALRHVAFTRKPHFSHDERAILAALPARHRAA